MQAWIEGCERNLRRVLLRSWAVMEGEMERGRVGVSRMSIVRVREELRELSAVFTVASRVHKEGSKR